MNAIHAKSALLTSGWAHDVRFEIKDGMIRSVTIDVEPQPGDDRKSVLLPAMPNLHSHAFQRAMAGLAEIRGPADDSFWSWRTVMYRFALSMTPDHVEAVAAQLYMEMLEAGYCRVGEFHYLHNDKDGSHYANIAEMRSDWRGQRHDRYRPDIAAGLLCPFRIWRPSANRWSTPLHPFA